MNPDDFLYEYAVVRYVPRVDREEFVNIGLIMMCKRRRWLKGLVEFCVPRIVAFDPHVDLDSLERQTLVFMDDSIPSRDIPVEEKYRWLAAVKSAVIQVSPSHPGIVRVEGEPGREEALKILEGEFRRLFEELVKISPS